MAAHRYSLSGSPFGWKIQLALEHLGFVHGVTMLSPDRGGKRRPGVALSSLVPTGIDAWAEKVEALPFHRRTLSPHWRTAP